MVDKLPQLWEKFSLSDVGDVGLEILGGKFQKVVSRGQACIVGKLIADQLVTRRFSRNPFRAGGNLGENYP